jgi:Carboxypeptidase regulatory-like domain
MRRWPLLLLAFSALTATAQSSVKTGTGTVTGHVYCADTNAPARMASVQLKPVKEVAPRPGTDPRDIGMPASGVVQTTLDGSFAIPNVAPGSYYVIVTASGYLSPHPRDDNSDESDHAKIPLPDTKPPVTIPRVDLTADQTANIDLRLERGAAVSGNIRFDDGSPATNVVVMLLRKNKDKWEPLPTGDYGAFAMPSSLVTDDLGHYRIGGLREGEYLLMATLVHVDMMPPATRGAGLSGTLRSVLPVYSGDTMRKSEAVSFKLGPGEDRAGMDIAIPLSKLHSISGVVTAASNGHAINNGEITIEDPIDKDSIANGQLDSDGAFHLDGVPEGSYTLRVQNASDKQNQQVSVAGGMNISSEKIAHQYGDLEQPLKVEGDIPNLVLSVPEQTKQHASQ